MKKLLLLAREGKRSFLYINGSSILENLPFPVIVFTDESRKKDFDGLGENVKVEIVKWSNKVSWMARARELHSNDPFLAISTSDELMMDVAARLREEFNLPGMGVELTSRFRDKRKMKDILGAAGMRVPFYVNCKDRSEVEKTLEQFGKIVIKPFDGLGSKGVVFIHNLMELNRWYDDCENIEAFEAEEHIEGTLYHVNAIVINGKAQISLSAPYLPGMANIDFSSGAPFVSHIISDSPLRRRLEAYSNDAIENLGMQFGITHMECFLTQDDEIVFCEIAARPAGGGLVWMMEAFCGVNFNRAIILLEAGRSDLVNLPRTESDNEVVGLMGFRWSKNGFVRAISDRSKFIEPWIHHYSPQYNVGEFVVKSSHCTDYVGLLIFSSQNAEEFSQRRASLYDRFYSDLVMEAV